MQAVLLIDFGSTYTKVTAVDLENEAILGTARSFTTVATDINEGLENALYTLKECIGNVDYIARYACSSAAGGLKMIAVGLVPDLTAEAAKRAALSAGAKVMKVYSYELSPSESAEIEELIPDIVLLTGGTDGGNKDVILHNAHALANIKKNFPVVIAGNKSVVDQASDTLSKAGKQVTVCANVMPEFNKLNIEPAREAIRKIFFRRIIQAKGLSKVKKLIEGILMPTPSAVLSAANRLSVGHGKEKGIGDLLVVDVGGATTDVHSIADGNPTQSGVVMKGLPEPFIKRTVEGDLGVRYSASALVESAGMDQIENHSGLSAYDIKSLLSLLSDSPDLIPTYSEELSLVDYSLTTTAVKLAVERHVGTIETMYTPFGATYVQTGKDLTGLRTVIGTGGPIINSRSPLEVLKQAQYDKTNPTVLKPQQVDYFLDSNYIFAAMGLLSEYYPETAIRIMKKELVKL